MDKQSDPETHETINSYYFMTAIIGDVILNIVQKDAMLAIFSFAFVFGWIGVNTGSWFLAFVGFFEIFFSIPVAWFLFTVVFRIRYFSTLNTLALFVVAAIGADDIFIFMDAYKQSQYNSKILTDLETRMSWVFRRTGSAMFITSATTVSFTLKFTIIEFRLIQSSHPRFLLPLEIVCCFSVHLDYSVIINSVVWNFCCLCGVHRLHIGHEFILCIGCDLSRQIRKPSSMRLLLPLWGSKPKCHRKRKGFS